MPRRTTRRSTTRCSWSRTSGRHLNMRRFSTSSTRTSIHSWWAARAPHRKPSTPRPRTGRRPSRNTVATSKVRDRGRGRFDVPQPRIAGDESFGSERNDESRPRLAGRREGLERPRNPQPVHHSDDPLPDPLYHLPLDLFTRIFVHRLCRQPQCSLELHWPEELSRPAERRSYLVELRHHRQVRDRFRFRADAGWLRARSSSQPQLSPQRARDHPAASADDDVAGGGGPLLAIAL